MKKTTYEFRIKDEDGLLVYPHLDEEQPIEFFWKTPKEAVEFLREMEYLEEAIEDGWVLLKIQSEVFCTDLKTLAG